MTFRIAPIAEGNNPLYWYELNEYLGEADIPVTPDWSYRPFVESVRTLGGSKFGRGYPVATWGMQLTAHQRYQLRQICPGLSAQVYIETPTNEVDLYGDPIWIQASAVMNWTDGDEDRQSDKTLNAEIIFTEIVEV